MAILFCDGFDSYGATSDLTKKWGAAGADIAWNSTAGRNGAGAAVFGTTGGNQLKTLSILNVANQTSYYKGFWFKASAAPAANAALHVGLASNGSTEIFRIGISTSGQIVRMSTGSTSINNTGATNVCDGSFHWIEMKVRPGNGDTSDGIEVYADGTQQFSVFGFFTNDNGPVIYDAFFSIAGITWTLDDVIIYDDSGSSGVVGANYPYGALQITTLRPGADSGTVQFTPSSSGSHYALVDEAAGDTSDYVESPTSGNVDLYDYADLGFTPDSIKSVVINSYMHDPFGSSAAYQVCKSSSTESDGSSSTLSSVASVFQREVGNDPSTSAAWTASGLNAAQFGVKVA